MPLGVSKSSSFRGMFLSLFGLDALDETTVDPDERSSDVGCKRARQKCYDVCILSRIAVAAHRYGSCALGRHFGWLAAFPLRSLFIKEGDARRRDPARHGDIDRHSVSTHFPGQGLGPANERKSQGI